MKHEKLVKFINIFAIMTNAEGAWPNLSSKQAIRANLVYIVSLFSISYLFEGESREGTLRSLLNEQLA